MSAAQQDQKQNGRSEHKPADRSLLEQVMDQTVAERFSQLETSLQSRIDKIEEVLPDFLKGQAERLVRRALITFGDKADLHQCTPNSFIKCVLQAAELGFAIDGRLCHAVPYNNRKKVPDGNGKEREITVREVQLQMDYKGLIAGAKRNRLIQDCWARIVYPDDDLTLYEENGKTQYKLAPRLSSRKGIEPLGILSVATHADGWWRVDWMFLEEVDLIRNRSKSYASGYSSPWKTDENEMRKKGLALDTPIPTPRGWTTMGELNVGDSVFDGNGYPTRVSDVSEVKRIKCYEVMFSNGDSIVCDDEHLWPASIGSNGSAYRERHGWRVHTVNELYAAKMAGKGVSVPVVETLHTDSESPCPIDPWLFGYWLGNGNSKGASLTCHLDDLHEVASRVESSKYSLGAVRRDPRSKAATVGVTKGLLDDLRSLGVLRNKHVPSLLMRGHRSDRHALLCGLMDSDGCIERTRGEAIFANTNACLSDAVSELATTLGETVNRHSSHCRGYGKTVLTHFVRWKPKNPPVTLSRKLDRFKPRKLNLYRSIKYIAIVPTVPTKCIAVESDTHTYLAGQSMVVTHNTGIRRLLKTFTDDPGLAKLFDVDDQDFENGFEMPKAEPVGEQISKLKQLTQRIRKPSPTHYVGPDPPQETTQQQESESGNSGSEQGGQSHQDSSESGGSQSATDTDPKFPNESPMTRYIEAIKTAETKEAKQKVYDFFFSSNNDRTPWTNDEQSLGAKIKTQQILSLPSLSATQKGQLFDAAPTAQQAGV